MYLDRALDAGTPVAPLSYRERRAPRVAFDMLVRYAWRGRRATAMLKDLTPFGARIEGVDNLRLDDGLTLLLPGLRALDARIAWIRGRAAGLAFDAAIPQGQFNDLVRDFATGRPESDPPAPIGRPAPRLPRAA